MKASLFSFAALLVFILAPNTWASTYTLSGATYNPTNKGGIYAATAGITGSFTTAAPLPTGLSNAHVAGGTGGLGYVTSWNFNDGVFTYTDLNSAIYLNDGSNFAVSTNGSGVVTSFTIILTMPTSGAAVGQPTEFVFLSPTGVTGLKANCTILAPGGATCQSYDGSTPDHGDSSPGVINVSFLASALPPPPTPAANATIPTLSQYLLAVIAALLAATGFLALRRKQRP